MGIHAKGLNQLAQELEARSDLRKSQDEEEWQRQRDRHQQLQREFRQLADPDAACDVIKDAERPVYVDSTLGVRTRAPERADLRKVESALRLDMGFVSRGDISGES